RLVLERGRQVQARSLGYHKLAVEMRLSQSRRKVDAGACLTSGAEGGDGNGFPIRGGVDCHLVAHRETVRAADLDFDIGRAGARFSRERSAARLRADARDRDGLDPMAEAV